LIHASHCFSIMTPPPSTSTLFPYTTLFRSHFVQVQISRLHHLPPTEGKQLPGQAGSAFRRERDLLRVARQLRRQATRSKSRSRRSEEHTSELQSLRHLVCRLLLEKKNNAVI